MATDPEFDRLATLETSPNGQEHVPPEPAVAEPVAIHPAVQMLEIVPAAPRVVSPAPARRRSAWLVPAAIAVVGLIASGTLGYFLYSTNTRLQYAQANLDVTRHQLAALQTDSASRKAIADYVAMYVADSGKVNADYAQMSACDSYATCRFAAQQELSDMQAFQTDRRAAAVPATLSAADGELGDGLSAGIAALQELIDAMDSDNRDRIIDGWNKLNSAMSGVGKAESDLGAALR